MAILLPRGRRTPRGFAPPLDWSVIASRGAKSMAPHLWRGLIGAGLGIDPRYNVATGAIERYPSGSSIGNGVGALGPFKSFNESGREGEAIICDSIGDALAGLTQFTAIVLCRFTGSDSPDEDCLIGQWNVLQGGNDLNAKRFMLRYKSNTNELASAFSGSSDVTQKSGVSIEDGEFHSLATVWDGSQIRILVDAQQVGGTTAFSGPIRSTSTTKVPEVMGGHVVTENGADSPRFDLAGWYLSSAALSNDEIASFLDAFRPRPLLVPVSAGGGGASLSPAGLTVSASLQAASLTQAHATAPAALAVAPTLAEPALTTDVQIIPAPLEAPAALGQPPLTQAHQVPPGALQVQAALGASALTQAHTTTPAALQVTATLQAAGLTQAHALSPDGLQVQGLLEAAALVQAHQLTPADLAVATALDQASLSVQGVLTAAGLTVAATLGQPGLTQAHQIAPSDLVAATALGASSVQVAFALTPAALQVDATLAQGGLVTGLTVVPADLVVPSLLAEPGLVQAAIIDPADMSVVAVLDATNFAGAPVELLEGHLMVVRAQRRIMVVRPQRRIMVVRR